MNLIHSLCGMLIATIFADMVAAQETSSQAVAPPTPKPAVSAWPAGRLISPRVAELLAVSMPKYQPFLEESKPVAPSGDSGEKPSNGVVRLPRYVVFGPKLPAPLEILTKKELERYAMEHYIGPEEGLDRGFLNLFTIAGIWKKIPLLGSFQFKSSETNEDRGMRLYETAEQKRKMDELTGLISLPKNAENEPGSKKMKQEISETLMMIRRAEFDRQFNSHARHFP